MTEESGREATAEEMKAFLNALAIRGLESPATPGRKVIVGPGDRIQFLLWMFRNKSFTPRIFAAAHEVFGVTMPEEVDDGWVKAREEELSKASKTHRERAESFLFEASSDDCWLDTSSEYVKKKLTVLLDDVVMLSMVELQMARELLSKLEWSGQVEVDYEVIRACCPSCDRLKEPVPAHDQKHDEPILAGHTDDCELFALLKKAGLR